MIIPYSYELICPQRLQAVYMGQISHDEARQLEAQMRPKRARSLIILLACGAVLAADLTLIFADITWLPHLDSWPLWAQLSLPLALLVSIVVSLSQGTSFMVASAYMRALKCCQPGSVTRAHPLYNLSTLRPDRHLIQLIAEKSFTAAEARGLMNIARSAYRSFMAWSIGSVVLVFAAAALPAFFRYVMLATGDYSQPVLHGIRIAMGILAALTAAVPIVCLIRSRTALGYIHMLWDYTP